MAQIANRHVVNHAEILGGEPIVDATRTPVRAVVEIWRAGTPAEEIQQDLPHLSMAQIFAALSYYEDHQEEIHRYMQWNRGTNPES